MVKFYLKKKKRLRFCVISKASFFPYFLHIYLQPAVHFSQNITLLSIDDTYFLCKTMSFHHLHIFYQQPAPQNFLPFYSRYSTA